MKQYKVCCKWEMSGYAYVDAESLDAAIAQVEADDFPLPSGEYVADSFEIERDVTVDLNTATTDEM